MFTLTAMMTMPIEFKKLIGEVVCWFDGSVFGLIPIETYAL